MDTKVKKPFDKKKWRENKYSKKTKGKKSDLQYDLFKFNFHSFLFLVDQWQDKRKKYIQSKYFRMLQKEGKLNNPNTEPLGEETSKR